MCEVGSKEKRPRTKKKKYNGQQHKEMDCHEPHPAPNEKMQGIQWTERPTSALVVASSLWPRLGKRYEEDVWFELITKHNLTFRNFITFMWMDTQFHNFFCKWMKKHITFLFIDENP
jgi:hypothetical protein